MSILVLMPISSSLWKPRLLVTYIHKRTIISEYFYPVHKDQISWSADEILCLIHHFFILTGQIDIVKTESNVQTAFARLADRLIGTSEYISPAPNLYYMCLKEKLIKLSLTVLRVWRNVGLSKYASFRSHYFAGNPSKRDIPFFQHRSSFL